MRGAEICERSLSISSKNATKRQSRMIGTITAHLTNMVKGVKDGFEYKLEICNVHFPMNVKVVGSKVIIKSFLGEKTPRVAKIISSRPWRASTRFI